MIVISGILNLDPAKAGLAAELTAKLVAATVQEDGNNTYEYWQDPADAGRWRVFEEWDNEDALNAHMATPHMLEFLTSAGDLGITGVDIARYEIDAKSKFM